MEDRIWDGVGQEKEASCQQQMLLVNLLIAEHLLCSRLGLRREKNEEGPGRKEGRREGGGQICVLFGKLKKQLFENGLKRCWKDGIGVGD